MGLIKNPRVAAFLAGGTFFTIQTIIGVSIGIGLGFGLRETDVVWHQRNVMYLTFVGDLFIRTLSALILPLIVSSLIDAVGSMDLSLSKKIGTQALVFYLATTAVAAVLGIILAVIVRPGDHSSIDSGDECTASESSTVDVLLDLVRNVFPDNLVGAAMEVTTTVVDRSNASLNYDESPLELTMTPGKNMMGLVVFSLVLGVVLGNMGEAGKPVLYFFKSLGEASLLITSKVVMVSPLAICFLIAGQLVKQDDIGAVFQNIAWYFATVMGGLAIHGCLILPGLYILLTRTNPLPFFANMFEALATAFGTASSSATLPVTMRCLEEKNKVDVRVSRFVIPIGATVNMNGTALYLPVGAIYIAQLCGRTLGFGELVTISLISIATSVGAAGIPQVGMIILMTVLGSVGLPVDYMGFIMPLDWLLERFRTAVNVLGDSIGAGIVAHMSKADLAKIDAAAEERRAMEEMEQGGVNSPSSPPPYQDGKDAV
ncbi:excitatory amino acid transporter 1 [Folsomia candida]|uniref:excitatory amino acid transporter 1 n=1 Tax=Folsomia candida TaxID=158441 RepID=UPI000B906B25|nr:excitatory amino acid transporter 1 [Folsomia candida]